MKAAPFHYHAPRSLAEALDLLSRLENARLLGGGQSLMPMLNFRIAAPDHLVDLGRIPELVGLEDGESRISIGAMTTQRSVERSAIVRENCPLLAEAVDHIGHQQTRNRGTIGGSLCHLDPGAELPVAALALDAELTVLGPSGARSLAFRDFPTGYLSVALGADEILTRIAFPKRRQREAGVFLEFNQRPADFAIVSAAVRLAFDDIGRVERIAIAIGGVQSAPVRLKDAEDFLRGQFLQPRSFEAAADAASRVDCEGDDLYPSDYRRELCGVLVRRALKKAAGRAGDQAYA